MKKKVCVVGLGHIGLPLACVLANYGFKVVGFDHNIKVIDSLKKGQPINFEKNLQGLLQKALEHGTLDFSTIPCAADIHIIAVPTPLSNNHQPDLSHVRSAIGSIKPLLRSQDLILIESTCPIGTTDQIDQELQTLNQETYIAYCPERVLPGDILHELIYNDRVVGGVNDASTLKAAAFYETFVKGKVHHSNARTAEAVKLAENSFRDVNIAFANELSIIADRVNLDVHQLIQLANKHPRVNILEPGVGVGGHCIAIDPWFLASAAPDVALLTLQAREVNIKKTDWVIQQIRNAINEYGAKSIACLGLSYKPNVGDTRESPAVRIVKALENEIIVRCVDPYVPHSESINEALEFADIVVGLVAHREFLSITSKQLAGKIVLDFGGVFKK